HVVGEHLVGEHVVGEHVVGEHVVGEQLAGSDVAVTGQVTPEDLARRSVFRVRLFVCLVAAASAVVWAVDLAKFPPLEASDLVVLHWWGVAIPFFLAEAYVVHLYFRKQAHSISATEIGLVLGLFLASPAALLVGQLVGAGLALVVLRRQRNIKLVFNLAELSLANGLALLVFRCLVGPETARSWTWVAALLVAALAHAVGHRLVTTVMALAEGRFSAPMAMRTLVNSMLGALAMASLGLLAVEVLVVEPWAIVLLAGPVLACGISLRAYWRQRQERERVEFLYESMRATQGAPEFGLAVGQLLVASRRLLRADYAEIVLLSPTAGEPHMRSVSGPDGERLMQRDQTTRLDDLALETVRGQEHPVLLPRRREAHPLDAFLAARGICDAIVGPLSSETGVMGLIVVGGRLSEVSTFSHQDLSIFETFSGHASVLLENGRLERSLAHVTELKEELSHQAYHDALTGLPNRLLFRQRVAESLEAELELTTHAVLFLDLNRFKEVNDSWGHAAGDELLQQVAHRLRECVRPADTASRLGGDEFAVLLPDTTEAEAEVVAGRVVEALNAPFTLSSGQQAVVRASIGIAATGADALSVEDLLRNADLAMYTAKTDERRQSHYQPALHARLRRDRETAQELEKAVERGEILAHFQPVISLADGSIQAFEALARWQHPQRGLLAPAEFLSIAEECGLIADIGAGVRRHAFRCANGWQDVHPDAANIGLWVNVSPAELTSHRLMEDLAVALTRARFDARRLTVEITESTVIRDEEGAHRAMHQLRDIGVHLSIDDFGTGYSSLSRLAEFPIEMLKIPKPFVDRLVGEKPDATFVDAILRLAGSLGLTVCSEGIEHVTQARTLTRMGCGLAQGYLYAKPLAEPEVLRLLRASATAGHIPSIRIEGTRAPALATST
ncbi:MAG: EAL domain-containing protein, partial [Actinomycetota bacterium]|nr:EAL domain-containing protein [Actinomycetota bacterium]